MGEILKRLSILGSCLILAALIGAAGAWLFPGPLPRNWPGYWAAVVIALRLILGGTAFSLALGCVVGGFFALAGDDEEGSQHG